MKNRGVHGEKSPAQHAGVILLRSDGAALLQHRDDRADVRHPGVWVNPGGRCERDELAEECARREFLEETGYLCGPLRLVGTFVDDFGPRWHSIEATVYCALYDDVQPIQCFEGRTMEFVTRREATKIKMLPALVSLWATAIERLGLDVPEVDADG